MAGLWPEAPFPPAGGEVLGALGDPSGFEFGSDCGRLWSVRRPPAAGQMLDAGGCDPSLGRGKSGGGEGAAARGILARRGCGRGAAHSPAQ